MIKEIKYNGFSNNPSQYECADGELDAVVNLVPEDGSMKAVMPPAQLFTLANGYEIVLIHKGNGYAHYIVRQQGHVYWMDKEGQSGTVTPTNEIHDFTGKEIYHFNAIGNTLLVFTNEGIYYTLWKGESNGYIMLGNHLPELPISFGLQTEVVKGSEFSVFNIEHISSYNDLYNMDEYNRGNLTKQVLSEVNKFIANKSTKDGKFIFPFLVRYAFRLYDSTLTMYSAPVLMVCASAVTPVVEVYNMTPVDISCKAKVWAPIHQLDYCVLSNSYISELLINWKDIVRSVDIFISKPIYTYDQNGECAGMGFFNTETEAAKIEEPFAVCDLAKRPESVTQSDYPERHQKNNFSQLYALAFYDDGAEQPLKNTNLLVKLPARDPESVMADIRDEGNFYLLKSIKLEELTTQRTIISVPKDYLESLVGREQMKDDYDSHDMVIAKKSFIYNSRLNITNISKKLFSGFNAWECFPFGNGYIEVDMSKNPPTKDISQKNYMYSVTATVCIRQEGKNIVVQGGSADLGGDKDKPCIFYFWYPNINAYKAYLTVTRAGTSKYYELPLEQHTRLNGAFFFGGWTEALPEVSQQDIPAATLTADNIIELPNKLYTSDVDNPFLFPSTGINTVGTGRIIDIRAAVKALSQGQFGQFPLYTFTDEGVWAMEVSDTGGYSFKQVVSRDVCINENSICSIDDAVIFATHRGIMLLRGAESQCISDSIDNDDNIDITTLQGLSAAGGDIAADVSNFIPFRQFIASCQVIYDYTHQRIIFFNPTKTYAYVFSLKSKKWGMMHSDIHGIVNSYPEAIAVIQTTVQTVTKNIIVNFSEEDALTDDVDAILITRPLKLEAPDILKTIDTVIQRGYFHAGNVKTILYGSRDLFHWQPVYSSTDHYLRGFRGTPYKYFRVALICTLTKEESIFGCTVQYTPRLVDQPR